MGRGYSKKYDAYFDRETGAWLEKKCGNQKCEFCANRPNNAYGQQVDISDS